MNISIIIPIRIDNSERLNNLNHCLSFLTAHFPEAEIIVVESDSKTKLVNFKSTYSTVKFYLLNTKERFCKSETMNYGLNKASMTIIATWDADIIIHPKAISEAYELMTKHKFKVISPHNTMVLDIKGDLMEKFVKDFDFNLVPYVNRKRSKHDHHEVDIKSGLVGGVAMFKKEALLHAGGYNRNMISYGWEDIEVLKRLNKLGHHYYIMGRYNMIHLYHPRGIDSKINPYFDKNKQEYYKVLKMSRKELSEYIRNTLYSDHNFNVAPLNDSTSNFSIILNTVFIKCIFSRIKHKILTTI